MEIPVIIASAPACPDEYRQYLGAMNLGALDFLCFPLPEEGSGENVLQLALEPYAIYTIGATTNLRDCAQTC